MIWGPEMTVPWKVHGRSLKWAGTQKGGEPKRGTDWLTAVQMGTSARGPGGAGQGGVGVRSLFISYRKLLGMCMVKSLSTSQVPPYNLSQTISTMTICCPFSPAGDSTGSSDHQSQGWLGPSCRLSRFLGVLGALARGSGDSRVEAEVALGTVTLYKEGGSARRDSLEIGYKEARESRGRALFQIQHTYFSNEQKGNFYVLKI